MRVRKIGFVGTPGLREAEVARLIGLGARRLWDVKNENFEWTTMADVEGNEFCVVRKEEG